ncbi:MAG: hypothetical protein H7840_00420 [Alphaproteobacteria bacterium]
MVVGGEIGQDSTGEAVGATLVEIAHLGDDVTGLGDGRGAAIDDVQGGEFRHLAVLAIAPQHLDGAAVGAEVLGVDLWPSMGRSVTGGGPKTMEPFSPRARRW